MLDGQVLGEHDLDESVQPEDASKTHLPSGSRGPLRKLWVKAGTQIIDGIWKRMRDTVPKSTKASDDIVDNAVRKFQRKHWERRSGQVDGGWRAV